jgi:hypothetical protein
LVRKWAKKSFSKFFRLSYSLNFAVPINGGSSLLCRPPY